MQMANHFTAQRTPSSDESDCFQEARQHARNALCVGVRSQMSVIYGSDPVAS